LKATSDEAELKRGLRELGQARAAELEPKQEELESLKRLIADSEKKIKRLVAEFANEKDESALDELRAQRHAEVKHRESLAKRRDLVEAEIAKRARPPEWQATTFQMARAIGRRMGGNPTVSQKRDILEALEVQVTFFRLEDRRRLLLDWEIGEGAALYLGDDSPCLPTAGWAPYNPRRRGP
jgi:hypothetical protein